MRTRSFRGVTLQPAGDSLIEETLLSPLVESQQIGPDRTHNHATAGVADSAEERTRLRPALAASLESEMGLRLVLDAADMGTFAWHIQEDRCEPDQRMLALFGVPPGRTFSLGDVIISFIHPEDQRRCADSFAHAIDSAGTGAMREEIRGLHSDGSVRWLSIIGQTVFDVTAPTSDGVTVRRAVWMSGLVSDITHRKHHEASLALLDQIADDCARLSTAGDIMQIVGARLGAYLHVPSVCLVNIDETRDELRIVHMWNEAGTASRPDVLRLSDCVTASFHEAARAGHTLVVHDTETDPRTDAVMHAALGVRSFISVPFIRDGAWRFMLTVCDTRPHHWPDDEVGFFRKLADRLFARLEHALAEQAVATDLRDTQLLRDLSVRLVSESDAQAFFDAIVAAAIPMTGAKAGCLRLLDSKTNELVMLAESGFDPPLADFGTVDATSPTCCCRALATGERAFIDYDDPGVPDPKGCFRPSVGIRTAQSTPLVTRAGRTLGMLSTYWEERHHRLSERELHFLDLLARQAAEMIERRRNESALRESEQRLSAELADTQLLQRLSAQLIEERGSASLYETLVDVARSIMRSEYATMQTLHPERGAGGELLLIASRGLTEEARQLWNWVRAEQSTTCALALRTTARVVVSDIASCGAMAGTVDQALLLEGGIRASQTTPLVSRGGKLLGMITTHWNEPHQPSERDFRLLDILARQAADLMERTQAEEALRRSERQLKEADRRKDEFLATLAQELRNPLAPLRTSLEVIRLAGDTPESVEEVRTTMEEQVDLLVRLVDDLLDVSRITSGKIRLHRRTTPLAPLVATAVQANRAAVDAGHVTLRVD